jgi:acid phosphatase family membrane protein YuiD
MYQIIILPIISGLLAQFIKMFIKQNKLKLSLKNISAYSGMPSGHSAIVSSLSATVGLTQGFDSPMFAISSILALIVMRDAIGIRRYLGEHGRILNKLVKDLNEDEMLDEQYPQLLEKIGHTPYQVLAGASLGILISTISYIFCG